MSEMIPFDQNNPPAHVQSLFAQQGNEELSEGVQSGYPVLSYRGSVWRIKIKGTETVITSKETGDPVRSMNLVLVKASKSLSKVYYSKDYEEGDDSEPDCASINGVKPDPGVPNPQSATCASCPHNVWGSKITPAGAKTKACSDSRRVAVVPANDIKNEAMGGPILLRVPAASLSELDVYGRKLTNMHVPYNSVVTKVSFDLEASYPKLHFEPVGYLDEYQMNDVLEMVESDEVERMLSDAQPMPTTAETEPAEQPPMDEAVADEPPPPPKKKRATKKKAAAKQETPAKEQEPPPPAENKAGESDDIDAMLDNVLSSLGG